MLRSALTVSLLLTLTAIGATSLSAQRAPSSHGVELGGYVQAASLDPEDDLNDNGGGGGLHFAYGFRNGVLLFLTADGSAMEPEEGKVGADYTLTQVDIGVRYRFRNQSRWRPFLDGAVTGIVATFEDVEFLGSVQDIEVTGPAVSFGAGIEYFFAGQWSSAVGVRVASGSFEEVKVGNVTVELDREDRFDIKTSRLQLGLRYHIRGD